MKNFYFTIVFCCLLAACGSGGGSEIGNPNDTVLRPLIGTVSVGGNASQNKSVSTKSVLGDLCGADTIQATDVAGSTENAELSDDCSFELNLTPGKPYLLGFIRDEAFIASLIVRNSSTTLETSIVFIAAGADPVDLGEVLIVGNRAIPGIQPATQNDRDGDGVADFDDDDDDNDGTSDDDEEDCDLDGFLDDDDDDICEAGDEDEDEESASVLEVQPRNNQGITFGSPVNLDEEIEVRFACEIDPDSVTDATFVVSSSGDNITCEFEIDNDEVNCKHEDDLFVANTTYTATLDGVFCENGDPVASTTWSWKTEEDE